MEPPILKTLEPMTLDDYGYRSLDGFLWDVDISDNRVAGWVFDLESLRHLTLWLGLPFLN